MGKYLLVTLVLVVFFLWFFKGLRKDGSRKSQADRRNATEAMVRCDHCGIHLPESEAIADGERRFCSEEHRRLARG